MSDVETQSAPEQPQVDEKFIREQNMALLHDAREQVGAALEATTEAENKFQSCDFLGAFEHSRVALSMIERASAGIRVFVAAGPQKPETPEAASLEMQAEGRLLQADLFGLSRLLVGQLRRDVDDGREIGCLRVDGAAQTTVDDLGAGRSPVIVIEPESSRREGEPVDVKFSVMKSPTLVCLESLVDLVKSVQGLVEVAKAG